MKIDKLSIQYRQHSQQHVECLYSSREKKVTHTILVDYESALCAGVALHGSLTAMNEYVSDKEARKFQAYHARRMAATQQSASITRCIRRPAMGDPFDGYSENPFRYVAIVRVPWLSKASKEVDWGFHCIGCSDLITPSLHFKQKFTTASSRKRLRKHID